LQPDPKFDHEGGNAAVLRESMGNGTATKGLYDARQSANCQALAIS